MPNKPDTTFTFPNGQVIKCKSLPEQADISVMLHAEPRLTFEEQRDRAFIAGRRMGKTSMAEAVMLQQMTRILPKRPAKRRRRLKLLIMRIYRSERVNGAIEFVMMAGFFALWVAAILVLAASVGS